MVRYLYRGVNPDLHAKTGGKLEPKRSGQEFKRAVYYCEEVYYGDGSVYGESESNAIIMHQRDSSKYPSSGVSTTPIFENAKSYATCCGKYQRGYVYKIDTTLLELGQVTAYSVGEYAVKPTIPDDREVILRAADGGTLPQEIVVEVICVESELFVQPRCGSL